MATRNNPAAEGERAARADAAIARAREATADLRGLHVSVVKAGQEVNYVELVQLPSHLDRPHRLRIRIRADSYVAQSWAKVERWDGGQWQEVYTIEGASMHTARANGVGLAYRQGKPTAADFAADRAELLARALDVLE
jgi:hypothetical protein